MRVIKAIPKTLLPHTISLNKVAISDWGDEEIQQSITITNVRIDSGTKLKISKNNQEKTLHAILFHDCVNSFPQVKYACGDIVEFCGETYHIESIDMIYAFSGKPHHYEIGLI